MKGHKMKIRYSADQVRFQRMTTDEIRQNFLVDLFKEGAIELVYSEIDRAIIGSAVPKMEKLALAASKELASKYFCERRELGILNTGSKGTVTVDGKKFTMENRDGLYVGLGSKTIEFESENGENPACFYLLSYPAHKAYPTAHAKKADATVTELGSDESCNKRKIYKYIHPEGIQSAQLVMGFTEMEKGNVWNTMPPHTHERRMEVYLYFDIPENNIVFHFMGKPQETRHMVMRNRQAVISPSWSIHSGAGTSNYTFIWGMGGENQAFDDMDHITIDDIK
jgi:4-deoxy-L-threo-5-hexosulose-uronate ketol-isomerase